MSREILFRAKRSDNKEWVEGNIIWSSDADNEYRAIIIPKEKSNMFLDSKNDDLGFENWHLVDPETICQYTGLTDKNSRKIFENDVVKFKHGGEFHDKGIWYRNYVIEYINTFCTYGLRFRNKSITFPCKQATVSMHDVEIIGNIFDNSELLKGDELNE